jgi:hypothetical protein
VHDIERKIQNGITILLTLTDTVYSCYDMFGLRLTVEVAQKNISGES